MPISSPAPRKHTVLRKSAVIAALLLSCVLGSCISIYTGRATIIDTGAIASIGQQRPMLCAEALPHKKGDTTHAIHYRVWKDGESYIVQLPVCYVPATYSVLEHYCGHKAYRRNTLRIRYPLSWYHLREQDITQYPVEHYYARMNETQYKQLCKKSKSIKIRNTPFRNNPILTKDQIDWSRTELVLDKHGNNTGVRKENIKTPRLEWYWWPDTHLPPRRTWYNYTLMPLSWAGEVIDIPLSLIATPIGWLVDAVYEPLAN